MKAYCVQADWAPKPGYQLNEREKTTMRAARGNFVWKNIRADIIDLPMPQIKEDEVLIKVGACGVCGSDIHLIETGEDGYTVYPGHTKFPLILGHEFAGEVVETGSAVKSVEIGDLIAVEQIQWCGRCQACRIGMFNQCHNLEEIGLSANGGFTEYAVVNEKFCCNINSIAELLGSKLAALEAGALIEPTSVAYSGMVVNSGGLKPGSNVVVFGTGAIGLASVSLAKAFGAAKIIVFGTNDARNKLAVIAGADHVINPNELAKNGSTPSQVVMELTKGIGAAMIVEAAGNGAKTYPEITKCIAIRGKIVQLGMEALNTPIDLTALQVKNAAIYGSLGHAGSDIYPSVLRMMASGRIDMRKIVTARFPLKDTHEAILASKSRKHGKVLVGQYY
jgi:threonine dehydrogenase-like Zn-dependent dehydrogenase